MGNSLEPIQHHGDNCTTEFAMDPPRFALCILEMSVNSAILAASALFALLLARTVSFSRNIKVLFSSLLLAAFNIAWTRLFLLTPQYISGGQLFPSSLINVVQLFHDQCVNVNSLIQVAITLECLLSSPFCQQRFSISLSLCLLNTAWPWAATICLHVLNQYGIFTTVPQFIFLEVLNLCSWITFVRLDVVNRRRYKSMQRGNVDGKYQITVRIRTLRTLRFLSALTTLRNFVTMALLLFIILYLSPRCMYYITLYCGHAYDMTVALYSLLLIVPLCATHNEFNKHFRQFLFGHRALPSVNPTTAIPNFVLQSPSTTTQAQLPQPPQHPTLRNAIGEQIVVAESPAEYFQRLAQSWQSVPEAKHCREGTLAEQHRREDVPRAETWGGISRTTLAFEMSTLRIGAFDKRSSSSSASGGLGEISLNSSARPGTTRMVDLEMIS